MERSAEAIAGVYDSGKASVAAIAPQNFAKSRRERAEGAKDTFVQYLESASDTWPV